MTMDNAGENVLDVICLCCGYRWADPWAAVTAPLETPCLGRGLPGALTVIAAIPDSFTNAATAPEIDLVSVQASTYKGLAVGRSGVRRQAATVRVAAADVRDQARALRQLAARTRAEAGQARAEARSVRPQGDIGHAQR
jgi:hypothetical protein